MNTDAEILKKIAEELGEYTGTHSHGESADYVSQEDGTYRVPDSAEVEQEVQRAPAGSALRGGGLNPLSADEPDPVADVSALWQRVKSGQG